MAGAIGAYSGNGADCDAELAALGTAIGRRFFYYAQKIVTRQVDHWKLQTFAEYLDVPVYKAEFDDCLTIFVVEDDLAQDVTVTLMLALRVRSILVDGLLWNGTDMVFLRDRILLPRLQDYFE